MILVRRRCTAERCQSARRASTLPALIPMASEIPPVAVPRVPRGLLVHREKPGTDFSYLWLKPPSTASP